MSERCAQIGLAPRNEVAVAIAQMLFAIEDGAHSVQTARACNARQKEAVVRAGTARLDPTKVGLTAVVVDVVAIEPTSKASADSAAGVCTRASVDLVKVVAVLAADAAVRVGVDAGLTPVHRDSIAVAEIAAAIRENTEVVRAGSVRNIREGTTLKSTCTTIGRRGRQVDLATVRSEAITVGVGAPTTHNTAVLIRAAHIGNVWQEPAVGRTISAGTRISKVGLAAVERDVVAVEPTLSTLRDSAASVRALSSIGLK